MVIKFTFPKNSFFENKLVLSISRNSVVRLNYFRGKSNKVEERFETFLVE